MQEFEPEHDATAQEGRWSRFRRNVSTKAAGAEAGFLGILRYAALTLAALVLLGATVYLVMGAAKQIGRTEVDPKQVSLAADDLAPPASGRPAAHKAQQQQRKPGITQAVRQQTLQVYRSKFKGFERADTKITEQQIVDYVWTDERIAMFGALAGQLHNKDGVKLSSDEAVMTDALTLVGSATGSGDFARQLAAFRNAKKVNVCTDEVRTRSRLVQGWDEYSTSCSNWYNPPMGCATTRVIDEPYTVKSCEMKFPDDLESPAEQFAAAVQRYADTAQARIEKARIDAGEATARNMARKVEGHDDMGNGGKLFLGFMAVMFLYLFVAMERHHRNLRALIERKGE